MRQLRQLCISWRELSIAALLPSTALHAPSQVQCASVAGPFSPCSVSQVGGWKVLLQALLPKSFMLLLLLIQRPLSNLCGCSSSFVFIPPPLFRTPTPTEFVRTPDPSASRLGAQLLPLRRRRVGAADRQVPAEGQRSGAVGGARRGWRGRLWGHHAHGWMRSVVVAAQAVWERQAGPERGHVRPGACTSDAKRSQPPHCNCEHDATADKRLLEVLAG